MKRCFYKVYTNQNNEVVIADKVPDKGSWSVLYVSKDDLDQVSRIVKASHTKDSNWIYDERIINMIISKDIANKCPLVEMDNEYSDMAVFESFYMDGRYDMSIRVI